MAMSVAARADEVKQPRGGYVPLRLFNKEVLDDGNVLHEKENLRPCVIGTAVDCLTRLHLRPVYWTDGSEQPKPTARDAFAIALTGAGYLSRAHLSRAQSLVDKVKGLDDESIAHACMLTTYDACRRAGEVAYVPPERLIPDDDTIENIRIMVNRCIDFFTKNGPVTCLGPTFEGGYTPTVPTGDGDLVTMDTIWDLKVMRGNPKPKHTLQLYMYYLMGRRSNEVEFLTVDRMGFSTRVCMLRTVLRQMPFPRK